MDRSDDNDLERRFRQLQSKLQDESAKTNEMNEESLMKRFEQIAGARPYVHQEGARNRNLYQSTQSEIAPVRHQGNVAHQLYQEIRAQVSGEQKLMDEDAEVDQIMAQVNQQIYLERETQNIVNDQDAKFLERFKNLQQDPLVQKVLNEAQTVRGTESSTQKAVEEQQQPSVSTESSYPTQKTKGSRVIKECVICSDYASVRCKSCGGDCYCMQCFKECHFGDPFMRDHQSTKL
ncbi:hypothetical protein MP228_012179 [Amoeboaphelidium protococcarum]|nr:hypothetical protein MP228_012179 [Amoeboaphelidium protococcarum]